MSANGNGNLVHSHPGNLSAARHGLHSDRVIADEIERHREDLLYVHLAREMFREEADRMGAALWGEASGTKSRYQVDDASPVEVPEAA